MIGRDTEFDAGSVGLRTSAAKARGALVRRLGAFERMYYRFEQKSTMHFCVVAELADELDPTVLDAALLVVQERRPLMNVCVEDDPQAGLGFTARRAWRRSRSPSSTLARATLGVISSPRS